MKATAIVTSSQIDEICAMFKEFPGQTFHIQGEEQRSKYVWVVFYRVSRGGSFLSHGWDNTSITESCDYFDTQFKQFMKVCREALKSL